MGPVSDRGSAEAFSEDIGGDYYNEHFSSEGVGYVLASSIRSCESTMATDANSPDAVEGGSYHPCSVCKSASGESLPASACSPGSSSSTYVEAGACAAASACSSSLAGTTVARRGSCPDLFPIGTVCCPALATGLESGCPWCRGAGGASVVDEPQSSLSILTIVGIVAGVLAACGCCVALACLGATLRSRRSQKKAGVSTLAASARPHKRRSEKIAHRRSAGASQHHAPRRSSDGDDRRPRHTFF